MNDAPQQQWRPSCAYLVQQMQQQATGQAENPNANNASQTAPKPAESTNAISGTDITQAASMADKHLAAMVNSGFLVLQANDYRIEMNLSQDKLTVNGKPFNPAMLKVQEG